jgi:hypothetical protein
MSAPPQSPANSTSAAKTHWEVRVVYWGLSVLFVFKFGKFIAVEIWDVVKPLIVYAAT